MHMITTGFIARLFSIAAFLTTIPAYYYHDSKEQNMSSRISVILAIAGFAWATRLAAQAAGSETTASDGKYLSRTNAILPCIGVVSGGAA